MAKPENKSGYLFSGMDRDPHVGNYSEPLNMARAREFNDKLDAIMVPGWDGKEKRKLIDSERAVLSGLYTNANILQDKLTGHNNDYSKCIAWVKGCLDSLHQAQALAEKNRVPFLKQEAEAILKKFNFPEK